MPATMRELGIDRWNAADRLNLADEIWQSLTADASVEPLPEATRRELESRVAELDANPEQVETWGEIKEFVRKAR